MPDAHCSALGGSAPRLERASRAGVAWWTDPDAISVGVVLGFSERGGGVSPDPYRSLNLGSHVGDDPPCVDENRGRLLEAVGIGHLRERLTMAHQVHGDRVVVVGEDSSGAGAYAVRGRPPIPDADALVTAAVDTPLMLCFADCVPVVIVAPGPTVGVAHAGWRGALASVPGKTVRAIANVAGCDTSELRAYIGAHIGGCHYAVGDEIMSQFCNTFGTVARAVSGGLDLDAVVTASLVDAGVAPCSIARLGTCSAEATDRFFSYRAENGRTGRHSAFACVVSGVRSASA